MKKLPVIILLTFWFNLILAQVYEIDTFNNQTVNTCTGTFYDSGGQSGSYAANEIYTVTFCPGIAGMKIEVDFTTFSLTQGDFLQVFNGPNTSSSSLGVFDFTLSPIGIPIQASAGNTSGCLTFVFFSQSTGTGWSANLSCTAPCQLIKAGLFSSIPAINPDSINIDICYGDTVTLTSTGIYPENNLIYHQSDSTSTFIWNFGNGISDTGQVVQVLYDTTGGYEIELVVIDTNGCRSINVIGVRVRVSTTPTFTGTVSNPIEICLGDTAYLTGQVNPTPWQKSAALNWAGLTYLPDGNGNSYTSILTYTNFAPGQTLTNFNDLIGIFATIEHSYLGDLEIKITCPNNTTCILKQYPGGGNTYLGEPIDNNALPIPGVGYQYSWTPTPTYGLMTNLAGQFFYSYINAIGFPVNNHAYLPSASYQEFTTLTSLVGCPLNGDWILAVKDNILLDNGFIFNWGLDFNPNILPTGWGFTPGYNPSNLNWDPDPTIINNNGINITVLPTSAGFKDYTFVAVDSFGCSYDTTISIYVMSLPQINLGSNIHLCQGDTFPVLDAGYGVNYRYTWTRNGQILDTNQTLLTDTIGTYYVEVDSSGYCSNIDSITISYSTNPIITFIVVEEKCGLGNGKISLNIAGDTTGFSYSWNTVPPQSTTTINNLQAGTYIVTITDGNCTYVDSTMVINFPKPSISVSVINNESCFGNDGSAMVTANGGTPPFSYSWSTTPVQTTDNATNLSAGTYTVTVSDVYCSVSEVVTIGSIPGPVADFTFTPNIAKMPSPLVSFTDQSSGLPIIWSWDFGDNTGSSNLQNPIYTYHDPDIYSVILTVSDAQGCMDSTSKTLLVKDISTIYFPNTFTPTNNDGLNDIFGPIGKNMDFETDFHMFIFDRWGRLVYFTSDYSKLWNGRMNNSGDILLQGVYIYKISVSETDGVKKNYIGSVTLL